ncbi:hypothetical protein GS511_02800 [Leptospira borgpetersenii]|nr:hypothetical protein IQ66_06700 [Leptospira borgpetersenii serovar Ballum]QHE26029.1 hypothetical protein GS524_02800 [Leptospira borgpetersenii]OOV43312.1 hypothetical protein B1H38_12760 [Leptospira borgpetersenii serovar Ballum]QHE29332.1 hypothetical protein GS523_02805 [Leptospira borgpetersenii]QHE32635.1 hypothetical protein GS517_02800 [Leptospira borgpetersenii]
MARVLEVSASESDRESLLRRDERAVEKDGDFVYYDSASEEKLEFFELFQDRIELFGCSFLSIICFLSSLLNEDIGLSQMSFIVCLQHMIRNKR